MNRVGPPSQKLKSKSHEGIPIGEVKAEDEIPFVFAPIAETRVLATGRAQSLGKLITKKVRLNNAED